MTDIRTIGLANYLNSTVNVHNGNGYKRFEIMLLDREPNTRIAKAFNVNRNTVATWIKIYREEKRAG